MRPESYKQDTNEIDFQIPTREGLQNSRYFSLVVIFLGVNMLLTILLIQSYMVIFLSVLKSRRQARASTRMKEEVIIALRMTALIMTNCMCWLPIIIVGILSQIEYISVSLDVYIWSVVFILPINASSNPYLYTILFR